MIIACSVLEMKPQDVYGLIHQIYKNEMKTEEEKRVMIDAVWFELSEYLRVSKYTFFFCSLKKFGHEQKLFQDVSNVDIGSSGEQRKPVMKAIKRFGLALMKMSYCRDSPLPMETEQ